MAPSTLSKNSQASKAPAQPALYRGEIHPPGRPTGIIAAMAGPADEVKLVVLDAFGDAVSERTRPVAEQGAVALNFSENLHLYGKPEELFFLMVKGYLKGTLMWETRLGRFQFPR